LASSIILAVKSVFDDGGLKKAQKDFGKVGKSLKGVLAGIGLGVGLGAAVSALKDAGKAAVTDAKSQAVLAQALKNTIGANDEVIASVENSISAWQMASGVADDQLRPAYQSLATATGSVSNANKLMQIALDLSASKQIGVEKAASMLAKAFNGNTTSLTKFMPELKGSSNLLGELEQSVKGMADAAANTDPFSRINVIFGEMQEQIGQYLIPYVAKFAEYLASDAGQQQMQQLVATIGQAIIGFSNLIGFIIENRVALEVFALVVSGTAIAWGIYSAAVAIMRLRTLGAASAQAILNIALGAVNPVALAVGIAALALVAVELASSTQAAADAQENLNKANGDYVPPAIPNGPLQASPTGSDQIQPVNPKPGEVYTWFRYEMIDGVRIAVWYQQTWSGTGWSKAVKMTTATGGGGGGGGKTKNAFAEFSKKLMDDAKKVRAIGVLQGKGLSEGLAEAIVSSGDQWVTTYNKIVNMGKTSIAALQKQFNATAKGQDELADKRKEALDRQKKADEEYADSVKSTFADIRDSIMGAFDITQMGKTAGGLLRNVNKLIAQTKAFADNIRSLAGQGLNTQLLNQLIMAGPMEGGRLAASLAASGAGSIGQLNAGFAEFQGLSTNIAAYGTLSQFGDKANPVINVTVNAGMGTDGAAVGKQVVDAILKYERTTGKIFARA
jgi:hypothetical protein